MYIVYEDGRSVGYITKRSYGYQFVVMAAYCARGLAAKMDETCGDSPEEVAGLLEKVGLVVRKERSPNEP